MKKVNKGIWIVSIPILALTILLLVFSLFTPQLFKSGAGDVGAIIRLTGDILPGAYLKGAQIEQSDTTQGLFGNTKTMVRIKLSRQQLDTLDTPPQWQPMPLPEEIKENLYGYTKQQDDGQTDVFTGFITERQIPATLENGIYYFHDSYAALHPQDTAPFAKRVAYAFEYAVIDYDSATCYLFLYA